MIVAEALGCSFDEIQAMWRERSAMDESIRREPLREATDEEIKREQELRILLSCVGSG
jgi:hypothetical protein